MEMVGIKIDVAKVCFHFLYFCSELVLSYKAMLLISPYMINNKFIVKKVRLFAGKIFFVVHRIPI